MGLVSLLSGMESFMENKMNELTVVDNQTIEDNIYTIRSVQVMLDEDLALLYGVETKVFNQAVKRNIKRFPEKFRFQLTQKEFENLRSQTVTSSLVSQNAMPNHGGRRYFPYVFTEQGVSMLSAVLRSQTAIEVSIKIIESFVSMRKFISTNADMFLRFERVEQRLSLHDENFNKLFNAIEEKSTPQKQHIFYDGQIFDAYLFVSDIVKSAKKSIKLIDNYVDESTLVLFTKRDANIETTLYANKISKQLQLDLKKHNEQYEKIEIKKFDLSHDRFLIIDEKEVYHLGASLKELGKKVFGFTKMNNFFLSDTKDINKFMGIMKENQPSCTMAMNEFISKMVSLKQSTSINTECTELQNQLMTIYLYFRHWISQTNRNFLVLDEQEENLHLKHQYELLNLLIDFTAKGNKLLLTTHSTLIAKMINNYVAYSQLLLSMKYQNLGKNTK